MMDNRVSTSPQFVLHQDRVYGYIVTLLPNRHDAEDVFQQTSLILWQKWDEFDPGGTLLLGPVALPAMWSATFSARRGRDRLVFSETLMNSISDLRLKAINRDEGDWPLINGTAVAQSQIHAAARYLTAFLAGLAASLPGFFFAAGLAASLPACFSDGVAAVGALPACPPYPTCTTAGSDSTLRASTWRGWS